MLSLLLAGCAATLNFNQAGKGANTFAPKTIAVLPIAANGDFDHEAASELISRILPDELAKRNWFDNVVDPDTIKTQVATNPNVRKFMTDYITTLQTTGVSDPNLAMELSKLLHVDAFFYCDISAFGKYNISGKSMIGTILAFKVIDGKTGNLVWKAGHRIDEPCTIWSCNIEKLNRKLINYMLNFMPKVLPNIGKK
jgi:hypothetical protein